MKKIVFWLALIVCTVALIGSCGKKSDSTATTATTSTDNTTSTLLAPSDVTATLGWHQVAVDWTAVSGASSYTVYWDNATGVSSSSTAITGITDDNYTHSSLDNGTTYYYKVATVNSAGTGSLSSEVSATPRTAYTVAEACTALSLTETPAGTWAGMRDDTLTSGQFFFSYRGETHVNGCTDNSTFLTESIASFIPSGTIGWKKMITMTGNTSFTHTEHYYAGPDCTKETGFLAKGRDNLSFGDNISIAGWPYSGQPYFGYATEDNYTSESYCVLAENEATKSFFSSAHGMTVTVGTALIAAGSGTHKYALMLNHDNISGSTKTWLHYKSHDNATQPDNWTGSNFSSSADVMYSLDNVSNQ